MTEPVDHYAVLEPGVPPIVTRRATLGLPGEWRSIDGAVWILGEPVAGQTGAGLWAVHLDARDAGRQCRATPRVLGKHTILAAEPLTLEPSLACEVCSWHGFVRDGHWTPAGAYPIEPRP